MIELYSARIDTTALTRGQIRSGEHRMGLEMLSFVLRTYHGVKELPEVFISDSGKPYLADRCFEFNVSHSHGRIVLALSDKPVGVDIERSDRPVPELVSKKLINGGNVVEWTKFECYSKLTGEGVYSVSYPPVEEDVFFRSYITDDSYIVSVCARENNFPAQIVPLTL